MKRSTQPVQKDIIVMYYCALQLTWKFGGQTVNKKLLEVSVDRVMKWFTYIGSTSRELQRAVYHNNASRIGNFNQRLFYYNALWELVICSNCISVDNSQHGI